MSASEDDSEAGCLRVMHVITGLLTGGAETQLISMVLRPRERAPVASVVSLISGGANYETLKASSVPLHDLGMQRGRPTFAGFLRLLRVIRAERPHVVQSWLYHADFLATVALACSGRWRETRFYWGVRGADINLSQYSGMLRVIAWLLAWLSRFPDGVVCNSRRGIAGHQKLGYRPKRWILLENGIDVDRFRPNQAMRQAVRAELGIPGDIPVVIVVARVHPMKDYACFLQAFSRVFGAVALLVGEGTERLPEQPRVYRLGRRDDIPALLAAADILVSSSASGEGFSNAIAEAMACGLPAVVTDVGDSARIVEGSGIVVPPSNPEKLADAITALMTEPAAERQARGELARERIVSLFSLDRSVRCFDKLYHEGSDIPAESLVGGVHR